MGWELANVIAFNRGPGVAVRAGSRNAIVSNSIFENDGLGIDLGEPGVNPNDPGDLDSGANGGMNFPLLVSATPGSTMVSGVFEGEASTTILVEIFTDETCDPSGHGEGRTLLGSQEVATDPGGKATLEVILTSIPLGHFITATATDSDSNTSEFSACVAVREPEPGPKVHNLFFPFYTADGGSFVGFAVSNFSQEPTRLRFSAFDQDGELALFDNNPADFELDTGSQLALLGHQILDAPPGQARSGWLQLNSEHGDIGSFFQFGTSTLSQLDGSVAILEQSKTLFFTRVFQGAQAFRGQPVRTFLSLANPNQEPIRVELVLVGGPCRPFRRSRSLQSGSGPGGEDHPRQGRPLRIGRGSPRDPGGSLFGLRRGHCARR